MIRTHADPGLDPWQAEVVACRKSPIRLVAPAGSGKTRTLVARAIDRLQRGLPPERLLLLTFDRAAAHALRRTLEKTSLRSGLVVEKVIVSTLNAFGFSLLREHAPEEYATILDGDAARHLAAEGLASLEVSSFSHRQALPADVDEDAVLLVWSVLKNALVEPYGAPQRAAEALATWSGAPGVLPLDATVERLRQALEAWAWLYAWSERELRQTGRMDFDDQKLRAYRLLTRDLPLRRALQERFEEVMVDEFQDVNRLDFELVRLVAGRGSLVVAGDDDQAIYGFRGCSPRFIIELEQRLGRSITSLELRANYRNPENLLGHATRLIRRNRERIRKRPVARNRAHAVIITAPADSSEEEAAGIVRFLRTARSLDPCLKWNDCAILFRINAQAGCLLTRLRAAGIPYDVREEEGSAAGPAGTPGEGVAMRTYFRAKGLQWRVVVLPGCNAGLVPHRRAPLEDERRLFYVALTRASETVRVSWVIGEGAPPPSPFLREAGLASRKFRAQSIE